MPDPAPLLDVASLAQRLDDLTPGQQLMMSTDDFLRLFGPDGMAQQRLAIIAKDHLCTTEFRSGTIVLQKLDEPVDTL